LADIEKAYNKCELPDEKKRKRERIEKEGKK
jgi:hypothetical protein